MNILFVCLGNICRSPLAEGIMRAIYEEECIDGRIESAATHSYNIGSPADQRSVRVAERNGIDIRKHRARQIRAEDFEKFDIIFVMDKSNEKSVKSLAPREMHSKIRRIHVDDVPDPYYGDDSGFELVFEMLHGRCRELVPDISARTL